MIEAGAVGARFTIIDEASPVLRRLMDQFAALQNVIERTQLAMKTLTIPPGVNRSLGIMETRFKAISDSSKLMSDTAALGFSKVDASIATTSAALGKLSTEMKALGAESRAISGPSLRYGGGGSRAPGASPASRSGDGVHFGGASIPLPGEQHVGISGTPAVAAGAAVVYGAYEEAKIQDFVNKIFLTGGISSGLQTANPLYSKIRDSILKAYVMTGLPLEQIEEGILTGTRGLAGIDLEKRLALMPGLLAASATEAYLKEGTSIPEAMQAFVGLAHMEGKYDPAQIAKLADHFAYLSTTTPVTVKQIEGAASYAIPMLRTADFDPEQILLMITAMERAGITNTKAGTWVSQLATQSFPGTSLMSKMAFKKHESALKALGLIDSHDKPTWFTDGRPDLVKMTGIAGDAIEKMDPAHRLAIEKALWGQQGGRAAGFFADPTNRQIIAAVAGEEKNFISGEKMWRQAQDNSPIVQFRTAFAGLNVELMNLGSNVLPYVTSALKSANENLGRKGELAVIAGGIGAWFNRKALGTWAGGWLTRLGLGMGSGPVGVLATLSQVLGGDTDRPDPTAADYFAARQGYTHAKYGWGRETTPYRRGIDLNPLGMNRFDMDAMRSGDDREATRGRALSNLPTPVVNTTVNVSVTLDGRAIAAAVESRIVNSNTFTKGPSAFDGRAMPSGTGMVMHGQH